ncbi:hypothetical protein [uncultured Thermomonospora sp.]|jgi:hypothetical protein|uniref:hypothetical protein n=1 Tax=uncultured Thermomonospora sp. TaxID=671175 RepID=UPI00259B314F|nr:hypothetical protein [uncultured Thermomonospora sp.]
MRRWAMRLVLLFAAFYIVTRPAQAADTASALLVLLHQVVRRRLGPDHPTQALGGPHGPHPSSNPSSRRWLAVR